MAHPAKIRNERMRNIDLRIEVAEKGGTALLLGRVLGRGRGSKNESTRALGEIVGCSGLQQHEVVAVDDFEVFA